MWSDVDDACGIEMLCQMWNVLLGMRYESSGNLRQHCNNASESSF